MTTPAPPIAGEIVQLPGWLLQDLAAWRDLDAKVTAAGERRDYVMSAKLRRERDEIGKRVVMGLVAEVKI